MISKKHIPNILSIYRIVTFPVLMVFVYYKMETLFVAFLIISLFSDLLDGYIARKYNWQSEFGSKLDSYGDILVNVAAILGVYIFKWEEIYDASWIIYLFFSLYILFHLLALIKYKTIPSFHTYAFKITGYLQGILLGVLFVIGYYPWMLYFVLGFSILAQIEELILLFKLKKPTPNIKGLFFLKNNK